MTPAVTVSIVTFNSISEIGRCLDCLSRQSYPSFEISVWDNASSDGTAEWLRKVSHPQIKLHISPVNIGFAAAHNRNITQSTAEAVLVLNPDCYPGRDYLDWVTRAMQWDRKIGAVAGRLYRLHKPESDVELPTPQSLLDSTGTCFTPGFRHLDRGSNEVEAGRFQKREWVFGVTGAAAFYRRAMLEDIKIEGEYFDEDFFAYREDADLAWRMQSAGWKCVYVPEAVGAHVRKVLPDRRSEVAAELNMHSVKNRFLFRMNNVCTLTGLRFMLPMTFRDLQVLGYVLLVERSSLPGLTFVLKHFRKRWRRRRLILEKRRVPLSYLHQWIRRAPYSLPFESGEASQ
ncbi:MAG: glycosyltransferase family 2 protein [Acidobacteriia bacterium]|nr:glycosyltransferase family 2 protein [Terriglobia bacterium]